MKLNKALKLCEEKEKLIKRKKEIAFELNKINKKLKKSKIKPYLVKIAVKIKRKYGSNWIRYDKIVKMLKKKKSSNVSEIVDLLVKSGFAKRKVDKKDKRKSLIKIKER